MGGLESNGRTRITDLSRPLGPASRLSGDRLLGVSAVRCSPWSKLLSHSIKFQSSGVKEIYISRRVECWGAVKEALSRVAPEAVHADEYTKNLTVFQAGSFALDVTESFKGIDFKPTLMSRAMAHSLDDNAPGVDSLEETEQSQELIDLDERGAALLLSEDHKRFLQQFGDQPEHPARPAYVLRKNTYLLLDPDLRRALDIVKRMRAAPEAERRAFVKNPRTIIGREMGLEGGDALVSALFIETKQYSERIEGLKLWEKPDLPWLRLVSIEWLPEKFPTRVHVDGRQMEVTEEEAKTLKVDFDTAAATQRTEVIFKGQALGIDTAREILRADRCGGRYSDPDKVASVRSTRSGSRPGNAWTCGPPNKDKLSRHRLCDLAETATAFDRRGAAISSDGFDNPKSTPK